MTERVNFKTRLQSHKRLQVPKYVRWQYKLETTQILKATINPLGIWGTPQTFQTRIGTDGRIVIPKLIWDLLNNHKTDLEVHIIEVTLEPA